MKRHPRPDWPLRIAVASAAIAMLFAVLLVTATRASAEPVSDPTRPMAALLGDAADVHPTKPQRSSAPGGAASAPVAAARLQSVQIGAGGKSSALLDGRLVHVGERIGEHSVAAIDRDGITLRGPRGDQRLPLLSGITQTASRAAAPADDTLATGTPQDKKP